MDTKYLAEFIALTETENYWQAANNLFISQSSLSKHIMSLERELGVTLFQRTTRRVKLTSDGVLFLKYARKIMLLLEEYNAENESNQAIYKSRISIASTSQITNYQVFTDILTDYKQSNLKCSLDIILERHSVLKQMLRDEKVDFIWIGESDEELKDNGFVRIPFLKEPLAIIYSRKSFSSLPKTVTVDELQGQDLIIQGNNSIENQIFMKFCQENGVTANISFMPIQSIHDFIKRELGLAVMLQSVAKSIAGSDLCIAEIENSPVVHVGLVYLKNTPLSKISGSFLRFLQESKQKQIESASP